MHLKSSDLFNVSIWWFFQFYVCSCPGIKLTFICVRGSKRSQQVSRWHTRDESGASIACGFETQDRQSKSRVISGSIKRTEVLQKKRKEFTFIKWYSTFMTFAMISCPLSAQIMFDSKYRSIIITLLWSQAEKNSLVHVHLMFTLKRSLYFELQDLLSFLNYHHYA